MATKVLLPLGLKVQREILWLVPVIAGIALLLWWNNAAPPTAAGANEMQRESSDTGLPANLNNSAVEASRSPLPPPPSAVATDLESSLARIAEASQFVARLKTSGMMSTIKGQKSFTLFVPTNGAFNRLSADVSVSGADLTRLLGYHIVGDVKVDPDALFSGSVPTLAKDPLNFSRTSDGSFRVNSSKIVGTYETNGGIIYVIDQVLLPPRR